MRDYQLIVDRSERRFAIENEERKGARMFTISESDTQIIPSYQQTLVKAYGRYHRN